MVPYPWATAGLCVIVCCCLRFPRSVHTLPISPPTNNSDDVRGAGAGLGVEHAGGDGAADRLLALRDGLARNPEDGPTMRILQMDFCALFEPQSTERERRRAIRGLVDGAATAAAAAEAAADIVELLARARALGDPAAFHPSLHVYDCVCRTKTLPLLVSLHGESAGAMETSAFAARCVRRATDVCDAAYRSIRGVGAAARGDGAHFKVHEMRESMLYTSAVKLAHDAEQLREVAAALDAGGDARHAQLARKVRAAAVAARRAAVDNADKFAGSGPKGLVAVAELGADVTAALAPVYNRAVWPPPPNARLPPHHRREHEAPPPAFRVIGADARRDRAALGARLARGAPGHAAVAVVDGLLAPPALAAAQKLARLGTVWRDPSSAGSPYLRTAYYDGLHAEVLLRLAAELPLAFPEIFAGRTSLNGLSATKFVLNTTGNTPMGENAEPGSMQVVVWLTPTAAGAGTGGLVVNNATIVPYACNRAIFFNDNGRERTVAPVAFASGNENRRVGLYLSYQA